MANSKVTARVRPDETRELELSSTDIQIPTPTDCKIFEEISKWSFERFMTVYENENTFRHNISNKALSAEIQIWNKWMNFALIFWLSWFILAWYMATIWYPEAWVAVVITELVWWITAFLWKNISQNSTQKQIEHKK